MPPVAPSGDESRVSKADWTSRNRFGQIAFVLMTVGSLVTAFAEPAPQGILFAAAACCAAVGARICQAEAHYEGK